MTKEEIQALIDAKIEGQGTMVDVGGALPAILSEILNLATQSPEIPHAIQLSDNPSSSMTTAAELAEIGLTFSEIEAAARGERTGVVAEGHFYPLFSAYVPAIGVAYIRFGSLTVNNSEVDSWQMWDIRIEGDDAGVDYYEV